MAKKTDASTGSVDASVLRRPGRETPSRKQTASSPVSSSPVSSRKSERTEKQTSPISSPAKNKLEKIDKLVGSSPLRRSDRGKNLVENLDSPNIKSTNEETANNSHQSPDDGKEDKKTDDQDVLGDRKRKRFNAIRYKALFKPQRVLIASDDDDGQEVEDEPPQANTSKENQMQQELDTCFKIRENHDVCSNMHNSKFVEFWVPIQLSNVQLEQYCATLLSKESALCSKQKSDTLGSLEELFVTNRKCCNHPYIVDLALQHKFLQHGSIDRTSKEAQPTILDVGIKASGKLHFLDLVLPEIRKHQLRVLILYHFQPTNGTAGRSTLGCILDDFVSQRFDQNSYEHLQGVRIIPSKQQAVINTFNKEPARFIFLLESRACHPCIKLSSVDVIIIYDSDINPSNDLKSLQKISIESQSDQIMIFRLYSSSTLEEKILRLAENNVAIDARSQTRSFYDVLLKSGVSDLFDKLTKFHSQPFRSISSGESLLKEVVEEFLYVISHKCKSNRPTSKAIIHVQNCGNYGKNSEVKTHLPYEDHAYAYLFWKKLLDRRVPVWRFVSESTPRQRKRPSYFLDSPKKITSENSGGSKTRRKPVNNSSAIEPSQLRAVTEGETGGVNEGFPAPNTESQSSSGDQFWTTTVNDEPSLLNQLKPIVSKLCKFLSFAEDVTDIVERFLEYVVNNFQVGKEDKRALQAFMISLCWIGSSLSKDEIDRSESFALVKEVFGFSCTEEQVNKVNLKLEALKGTFLKSLHVPAPEGFRLVRETSQQIPDADASDDQEYNMNGSMEGKEEFQKIRRKYDETRASFENEYEVEKLLTLVLFKKPSIMRSERLKILEMELAKKLEDHERSWETALENLKKRTERQVVAEHEVAPKVPENRTERQNHAELLCEGANDIESTGSHTSEREMVDVTVSGERVGETLPDDVVPAVEAAQMGMPAGTCDKKSPEEGEICPDRSNAGDDHNETCPNEVLPRVESAEVATPACNEKNVEDSINEGYNDPGGISGSNPVCAATSKEKTPSVQPNSSPAADRLEPIIQSFQEIQSEPLQEQHPDSGVQDEESNVGLLKASDASQPEQAITDSNVGNLQPSDANQPDQIVSDVNVDNLQQPSDASQPDQFITDAIVGNLQPSDANQPDQIVSDVNVGNLQPSDASQPDQIITDASVGNLQPSDANQPDLIMSDVNVGNLQPSDANQSDQIISDVNVDLGNLQLSDASEPDHNMPDANARNLLPSDASQPDQIITDANIRDLQPHDASPVDQIIPTDEPDAPPSTDPTVAETPSGTLPHTGPSLESTCEEPQSGEHLEENQAASIEPSHEVHQPDLVTSVAPTPTLPVNLLNMFDNIMNQVNPLPTHTTDPLLAEVERLHIVKDNVAKFHQETKQKLNLECEKEIAEIVAQIKLKYEAKHQEVDAAYNSKTMELVTNINRVHLNKILADAFRSKCQDLNSSGHSGRQQVAPVLMQQVHRSSSVSPSTRRSHGAPSLLNQLFGSQPPPPPPQLQPRPPLQIVHQAAALFSSRPQAPNTNNSPPSTSTTRPPSGSNMATSSTVVTTTRLPPGSNTATPSPMPNRAPLSIAQIDMSAANSRINAETRGQAQQVRPLVSSEPRAPAPHMRPLIINEPRAPAPHIRHLVSNEPRAPAPHLRSSGSGEFRTPAPHIRPFRSTTPPGVGTYHRNLSTQPVSTSSPQPLPPLPSELPPLPPPPPPEPYPAPPSTTLMDGSRWANIMTPQPDVRSQTETVLDVDDYIRDGTALVCLSDDD